MGDLAPHHARSYPESVHRQPPFLEQPFLIVDLGQYDVILGRKRLATHNVWLDIRQRRLIWSGDRSASEIALTNREATIPKCVRWTDANKISVAGKPTQGRGDEMRSEAANRALMEWQTEGRLQQTDEKIAALRSSRVDIAAIGAAPFHRHMKKRDSELMATRLSWKKESILRTLSDIVRCINTPR